MLQKQIALVANIRQSVYQSFGARHLQDLARKMNIGCIPIITNLRDCVEERAKKLADKVKHYQQLNSLESVHLISYSSSGIDSRWALANLGLHERVRSLVTICSPHHGARSAKLMEEGVFTEEQMEPMTRLMGIGLVPFSEFHPSNMAELNKCAANVESIKYFSIGAEVLPNACNQAFRKSCLHLRERTLRNQIYENDGVFGYDQITWGHHLVNFQADHAKIMGIGSKGKATDCLKLSVDAIKNEGQNKQAAI